MRSFFLVPLASLALMACSDATGGVPGGEPLAVDPCAASLASGSGHRWQDLYTCYFGPSGKASCASQGVCHGAPDQAGAQLSGFVCGPSRDACWQGITPIASLLPHSTDGTQTVLYGSLRKQDGTGLMPCTPISRSLPDGGTTTTCGTSSAGNYVFTPDDLARIVAWIQEGAQDN
jgi:hypothetical protein